MLGMNELHPNRIELLQGDLTSRNALFSFNASMPIVLAAILIVFLFSILFHVTFNQWYYMQDQKNVTRPLLGSLNFL